MNHSSDLQDFIQKGGDTNSFDNSYGHGDLSHGQMIGPPPNASGPNMQHQQKYNHRQGCKQYNSKNHNHHNNHSSGHKGSNGNQNYHHHYRSKSQNHGAFNNMSTMDMGQQGKFNKNSKGHFKKGSNWNNQKGQFNFSAPGHDQNQYGQSNKGESFNNFEQLYDSNQFNQHQNHQNLQNQQTSQNHYIQYTQLEPGPNQSQSQGSVGVYGSGWSNHDSNSHLQIQQFNNDDNHNINIIQASGHGLPGSHTSANGQMQLNQQQQPPIVTSSSNSIIVTNNDTVTTLSGPPPPQSMSAQSGPPVSGQLSNSNYLVSISGVDNQYSVNSNDINVQNDKTLNDNVNDHNNINNINDIIIEQDSEIEFISSKKNQMNQIKSLNSNGKLTTYNFGPEYRVEGAGADASEVGGGGGGGGQQQFDESVTKSIVQEALVQSDYKSTVIDSNTKLQYQSQPNQKNDQSIQQNYWQDNMSMIPQQASNIDQTNHGKAKAMSATKTTNTGPESSSSSADSSHSVSSERSRSRDQNFNPVNQKPKQTQQQQTQQSQQLQRIHKTQQKKTNIKDRNGVQQKDKRSGSKSSKKSSNSDSEIDESKNSENLKDIDDSQQTSDSEDQSELVSRSNSQDSRSESNSDSLQSQAETPNSSVSDNDDDDDNSFDSCSDTPSSSSSGVKNIRKNKNKNVKKNSMKKLSMNQNKNQISKEAQAGKTITTTSTGSAPQNSSNVVTTYTNSINQNQVETPVLTKKIVAAKSKPKTGNNSTTNSNIASPELTALDSDPCQQQVPEYNLNPALTQVQPIDRINNNDIKESTGKKVRAMSNESMASKTLKVSQKNLNQEEILNNQSSNCSQKIRTNGNPRNLRGDSNDKVHVNQDQDKTNSYNTVTKVNDIDTQSTINTNLAPAISTTASQNITSQPDEITTVTKSKSRNSKLNSNQDQNVTVNDNLRKRSDSVDYHSEGSIDSSNSKSLDSPTGIKRNSTKQVLRGRKTQRLNRKERVSRSRSSDHKRRIQHDQQQQILDRGRQTGLQNHNANKNNMNKNFQGNNLNQNATSGLPATNNCIHNSNLNQNPNQIQNSANARFTNTNAMPTKNQKQIAPSQNHQQKRLDSRSRSQVSRLSGAKSAKSVRSNSSSKSRMDSANGDLSRCTSNKSESDSSSDDIRLPRNDIRNIEKRRARDLRRNVDKGQSYTYGKNLDRTNTINFNDSIGKNKNNYYSNQNIGTGKGTGKSYSSKKGPIQQYRYGSDSRDANRNASKCNLKGGTGLGSITIGDSNQIINQKGNNYTKGTKAQNQQYRPRFARYRGSSNHSDEEENVILVGGSGENINDKFNRDNDIDGVAIDGNDKQQKEKMNSTVGLAGGRVDPQIQSNNGLSATDSINNTSGMNTVETAKQRLMSKPKSGLDIFNHTNDSQEISDINNNAKYQKLETLQNQPNKSETTTVTESTNQQSKSIKLASAYTSASTDSAELQFNKVNTVPQLDADVLESVTDNNIQLLDTTQTNMSYFATPGALSLASNDSISRRGSNMRLQKEANNTAGYESVASRSDLLHNDHKQKGVNNIVGKNSEFKNQTATVDKQTLKDTKTVSTTNTVNKNEAAPLPTPPTSHPNKSATSSSIGAAQSDKITKNGSKRQTNQMQNVSNTTNLKGQGKTGKQQLGPSTKGSAAITKGGGPGPSARLRNLPGTRTNSNNTTIGGPGGPPLKLNVVNSFICRASMAREIKRAGLGNSSVEAIEEKYRQWKMKQDQVAMKKKSKMVNVDQQESQQPQETKGRVMNDTGPLKSGPANSSSNLKRKSLRFQMSSQQEYVSNNSPEKLNPKPQASNVKGKGKTQGPGPESEPINQGVKKRTRFNSNEVNTSTKGPLPGRKIPNQDQQQQIRQINTRQSTLNQIQNTNNLSKKRRRGPSPSVTESHSQSLSDGINDKENIPPGKQQPKSGKGPGKGQNIPLVSSDNDSDSAQGTVSCSRDRKPKRKKQLSKNQSNIMKPSHCQNMNSTNLPGLPLNNQQSHMSMKLDGKSRNQMPGPLLRNDQKGAAVTGSRLQKGKGKSQKGLGQVPGPVGQRKKSSVDQYQVSEVDSQDSIVSDSADSDENSEISDDDSEDESDNVIVNNRNPALGCQGNIKLNAQKVRQRIQPNPGQQRKVDNGNQVHQNRPRQLGLVRLRGGPPMKQRRIVNGPGSSGPTISQSGPKRHERTVSKQTSGQQLLLQGAPPTEDSDSELDSDDSENSNSNSDINESDSDDDDDINNPRNPNTRKRPNMIRGPAEGRPVHSNSNKVNVQKTQRRVIINSPNKNNVNRMNPNRRNPKIRSVNAPKKSKNSISDSEFTNAATGL